MAVGGALVVADAGAVSAGNLNAVTQSRPHFEWKTLLRVEEMTQNFFFDFSDWRQPQASLRG